MPHVRDGATKVSDPWVRSPLLDVSHASQICHKLSETESLARVDGFQSKIFRLLQNAGAALMG
jgi:nitrite reductase (cytochrome c-552)